MGDKTTKLTKWVILLRAVNVSGKNIIKMAEFREMLTKAGYQDVKTYIQSGNIVLESAHTSEIEIANAISDFIREKFDYDVPVMAKTHNDFLKVIPNNPYRDRVLHEKEKLYVGFMKTQPSEDRKAKLTAMSNADETFEIAGNEVYIVCMKDGRKLQFSNMSLERILKVPVTTRNWNTVNKLCDF